MSLESFCISVFVLVKITISVNCITEVCPTDTLLMKFTNFQAPLKSLFSQTYAKCLPQVVSVALVTNSWKKERINPLNASAALI